MSLIKIFRNITFSFLCGLITLELGSYILTKNGLLVFNKTPSFYSGNKDTVSYWRTENSAWGAWHVPNKKGKASSECYIVDYISNEIGARDTSFKDIPEDASENIVLLGDSFAEGVGVSLENTSQFILEKSLKKNILNFGSAYNFGPLQYQIIYEELASKFNHDRVIIYFLPANDFTDNDYDYWSSFGYDTLGVPSGHVRHRPYYETNQVTGAYFYPDNMFESFNIYEARGFEGKVKNFIATYFWTYNVLKTIQSLMFVQEISWKEIDEYSGYFQAELIQQKNVISSIKNILHLARGKKVTLVSIPSKSDYWNFYFNNKDPETIYWHKKLKEIDKKENNFSFIDLISEPVDDYNKLFHSCDGHWSVYGNSWVADILKYKLKEDEGK